MKEEKTAMEKELDKRYGKGFSDSLKCKKCGSDLIECNYCHNMICPKGCD